MKIRLRPFRTFTRSRTLPSPTRDPEVVKAVGRELLERFDPADPVRLIGVGVAGLAADGEAAPSIAEGDPPARSRSCRSLPGYLVARTTPVVPNPSFALVAAVRSHSRLPAIGAAVDHGDRTLLPR